MTIMGNLRQFFQVISLFVVISPSSGKTNFNREIYKLANEIFHNYFRVFKCVTYAADDVDNLDFLERTLPMFIVNLSAEREEVRREVLREAFEQGCGAVIVQTGSEYRSEMVRALRDAKTVAVSYRYNRERYLFLPASPNDTDPGFLFDDASMFFLPNLVFVSPDGENGSYRLNGHTVFNPEKGAPQEVVDAWSPSGGFRSKADLYPDKVKDVNGKLLLFGVIHYIPYSVIIHEGNRTIYDGIEARIAAEFVKRINGTSMAFDHPVELWGSIFPNGSGDGIMGSILRHDADLGYAAIYQWYCEAVDCTYPYIQAEVTCLVPKPNILSSWTTLFLPFATSTWIGLIVAYIISITFLIFVNLVMMHLKGKETSGHFAFVALQSAFNIFRIQINQIPKFASKNHPLAVFIKFALFFYFPISIFWQSGIASILTVPRYEKAIDTTADLVSRWPKINWGASSNVWVLSIVNTTDRDLRKIVDKYTILNDENLMKRTRERNFAYFIEKLPNKHFGFKDYINEDTVPYLRLMQHHIYTANTVLALPRGSPYTEKLDQLIHWFIATGNIQKLEIQVSLERINDHLQNMIRYSNDKQSGHAILTVSHIQGPLFIYFGGIFISMIIFACEKFLHLKDFIKIHRKNDNKIFYQR